MPKKSHIYPLFAFFFFAIPIRRAVFCSGRRCSSESRGGQNGQQRIYGYVGGSPGDSDVSPATHRVQEWLSGRPPIKDIGECKRSVLDQIR